jgi:hypothetical protein
MIWFSFLKKWRNGKGDFSWGIGHPVGGKAQKSALYGEKTYSGTFQLGLQW